jgi:hypothetical protein
VKTAVTSGEWSITIIPSVRSKLTPACHSHGMRTLPLHNSHTSASNEALLTISLFLRPRNVVSLNSSQADLIFSASYSRLSSLNANPLICQPHLSTLHLPLPSLTLQATVRNRPPQQPPPIKQTQSDRALHRPPSALALSAASHQPATSAVLNAGKATSPHLPRNLETRTEAGFRAACIVAPSSQKKSRRRV